MKNKLHQSRSAACLCASALITLTIWSLHAFPRKASTTIAFERKSSVVLKKGSGQVDSVYPLSGGNFLVRDADFLNETTQRLEVYGADGRLISKIGSYGEGPGHYLRLGGAAVSFNGIIWVADLARISKFDMTGRLLGTTLVENPTYHVTEIALDEPHGFYYLAGCLPNQVYLDLGCKLVHQYRLSDGGHLKDFIDTDPEALAKHLLSLEWYSIDVGESGTVYMTDLPVLKLLRLVPNSGQLTTWRISSRLAKPMPPLASIADPAASALLRSSAVIDRVIALPGVVVVSVRLPGNRGYVLEVFTKSGKQIAEDLQCPGRPVGKTRQGSLIFVTRAKGGFLLGEYSIVR